MLNLWSCCDAAVIEAVAPLARVAPGRETTAKIETRGAVRVVPIVGPMTRYGLTDSWRGSLGTSTEELTRLVRQYTADAAVSGVLFYVNSPGGSTGGLVELADAVAELSAKKPTGAYVDGLAASAAYHAIAQVRQITATRGSWLGAIGTYAVVVDVSQALQKAGIRVIPIATSELKTTGLIGTELTEKQQRDVQRIVDQMQGFFDDAVQRGRKLNAERLENVRTGTIYPAAVALTRSLADAIGTMDGALTAAGFSPDKPVESKAPAYAMRPRNTALRTF